MSTYTYFGRQSLATKFRLCKKIYKRNILYTSENIPIYGNKNLMIMNAVEHPIGISFWNLEFLQFVLLYIYT